MIEFFYNYISCFADNLIYCCSLESVSFIRLFIFLLFFPFILMTYFSRHARELSRENGVKTLSIGLVFLSVQVYLSEVIISLLSFFFLFIFICLIARDDHIGSH